MALFNRNIVLSRATTVLRENNRNYYSNEASAIDSVYKSFSQSAEKIQTFDIFLSHSYTDKKGALGIKDIKEIVIAEMKEKTADFQDKLEFIKNPAVLELGKGFAFVSRQQHIQTETAEFYIDLVFYNFILKCFVLIELKTNKITHQDIGQLDMYVRMFDDIKKRDGDNPTIGILLCTETDKTIARYSVLNENQQLFAAKYMPYLPTEEELITEIERQKEILKIQFNSDKNTSDV
jgi:predicted nuclease of restriction endonuclease-like (RecB) superfamily